MTNVTQWVAVIPTAVLGLGGMVLALAPRGEERIPAFGALALLLVALSVPFLFEGGYTAGVGASGVLSAGLFGAGFLHDPVTWFFTVLVLTGTLVVVAMSFGRLKSLGISSSPEYYGLLLMTSASAIVLVGAGELITLFVGLEALSLGLYCLCGSAVSSRRSVEGALKYFILGSFSSAFLLYGMSVLYGVTGSTELAVIARELVSVRQIPAIFGVGMILVGVFFKLGAVPFHFWAPDVYQGAPTPVTAYMASVVKAAALAMAMRLLWIGFGHVEVAGWWLGSAWTVALLTMIVGNIVAVRQRNVKRMLAYSSVAHVGYMTAALLTPGARAAGGGALLFYIVAYSVVTFGAFAVTMAVTGDRVDQPSADDISSFAGLSRTNPRIAAAMTLFLLTLAGLPPGIVGLVGKFYLLSVVVQSHFVGLAVVAAICSAISCYFYLRVISAMYVQQATDVTPPHFVSPLGTRIVIGSMVAASIILGVSPSFVHNRAQAVAHGVFVRQP